VMLRLVGEAESVKFGVAATFTVRWTVVVWFRLPQMPVMVTVAVPVVAVLLAVNVRTLVLVAGFVPNDAVTPDGKPDAESITLPVKPLVGVIVIVLVPPVPPCVIVTLVGEADKLKFAAALTVNETVVVCVTFSPVPVTVIEYVPVAVVAATARIMVEVPEPGAAMDVGLKLTVTPVGWPVAVKATAAPKPPEMAVVIVDVPLLPCTTDTEVGEAEMVKLGVDDVAARALIRLAPFGLPQPLSKS